MDIYLRALEVDDYVRIQKWRNDVSITNLLGGNRFFVSKLREKHWVEEAILNDRKNLHLAICIAENQDFIGMVNLTNIDQINRKAEFSIFIGESSQHGKGYGKQAMKQILSHGFEQLNLNKIYLTVLTSNEPAVKMYKQLGFNIEGILRQEVYKNNNYLDMFIMSILKSEYAGLL